MICFFLFYNKARGVQRHFAFRSRVKHCDCICYDGKTWILFQFSDKGVEFESIKVTTVGRMLEHLPIIPELVTIIGVEVEREQCFPWKPFWVRSCNELCRYLTGVKIGFTLNPRHLLKKLLKYNGKRNFQVIYAWRRESWDYSEAVTSRTMRPMT